MADEYSRELGEFDPQMEEEDERPIDPISDIDITSLSNQTRSRDGNLQT